MAELSVVASGCHPVLLVFGYFFSTIANWIAAPSMVYWLNNWKHD